MNKNGGVHMELHGMDDLLRAFRNIDADLEPSIIRAVARKPATKVVSGARRKFTRKDTGKSKRSIAILPVKDRKQRFLEIGVKGKSLAYIWMFWKGKDRHKKSGASTGSIEPLGNVVAQAANELGTGATTELAVDLNSVLKRVWRKYRIR